MKKQPATCYQATPLKKRNWRTRMASWKWWTMQAIITARSCRKCVQRQIHQTLSKKMHNLRKRGVFWQGAGGLASVLLIAMWLVDAGVSLAQGQTSTNAASEMARSTSSSQPPPARALETLCMLLIGTLCGAGGQIARAVVGIKKELDAASAATTSQKWEDWFNGKQLLISVLLGGVAGAFASALMLTASVDKKFVLGCIAAGYAGSDFIEGFMTKNCPQRLLQP